MRFCLAQSFAIVVVLTDAAIACAEPWQSIGPGPAEFGQSENLPNQQNEVAGAVRALAPHPVNPDVLLVGAVNGGIWMTSNARDLYPIWTPLTDQQRSLSVSSLRFDPADPSASILFAGIGRYSSLGGAGGASTGLLRSGDGGQTWDSVGEAYLSGKDISAVAVRGALVMAAASAASNGSVGLYRSDDFGNTFELVSGSGNGLPPGPCVDLIADPDIKTRYYAAVLGGDSVGVYRSDNLGLVWWPTGKLPAFGPATNNMRLAVHATASTNAVYVSVTNNGRLADVYRATLWGLDWAALGVPQTSEGTLSYGVNVDAGGGLYASIVADPMNPNVVYVGGDRQPAGNNDSGVFPNSIGAKNYSGRLFKCDASLPPQSRWTPLTHIGTANNSAPHADSRAMAFDAEGNLIEASGGGVYRRTSPATALGDWQNANGNLSISESHSADWDSVNMVGISGSQDNGVAVQDFAGDSRWSTVLGGNGGKVAVDDSFTDGWVYYYGSSQFLQSFFRAQVDGDSIIQSFDRPGLRDMGSGLPITQIDAAQPSSPLEINKTDPSRLIILLSTLVVESDDRGETVTSLGTVAGTPTAAAAGGFSGGVANDDLLWVGSTGGLARRMTRAGGLVAMSVPITETIRDIVIDPDDSRRVVVITSTQVWLSTTANAPTPAWTNITGTLVDSALLAAEFIPTTDPVHSRIVVGGAGGVFTATMSEPTVWTELDSSLPNAPVRELRLDPRDGMLCAATLGRGVWLYKTYPCRIDFDNDGLLTFDDVVSFVEAFEQGRAAADFNRDGFLDFGDVDAFVAAFESGCGPLEPPPVRGTEIRRSWHQQVEVAPVATGPLLVFPAVQ